VSQSCDQTNVVYDERTVRARKAHVCDACERTIRPGDRYKRIGILFDGRWGTVVRCGSCQKTHEHLRALCRLPEYRYDQLWPDEQLNCGLDYAEEWGNAPPADVQALPLLSNSDASALLAPAGRKP